VTASTTALILGLLLIITAAMRIPGIYRDMLMSRIDLSELLRARFDILSGGMLVLLSTALPR
jgi:hypothetical protein